MPTQIRGNRRQGGASRGAQPARRPQASARSTAAALQEGAPDHTNRNGIIFLIVSIYLIATLLYRVFVPAHESPLRTEQLMTIGLDVLCLAGLVAIKKHVPGWWILFWVAFVAGLGLLAIRFDGDESSLWTGHLYFTLEPR
jgi:hypothetical protein